VPPSPSRQRLRRRICRSARPTCGEDQARREPARSPRSLLTQLAGQDDDVVWRAAQRDARFLITQDSDFSDARKFVPGTHHGLLLVSLPQPGQTALFGRIAELFQFEKVEEWGGCMVTTTSRKVRVDETSLRPRDVSAVARFARSFIRFR